MKFMFVSVLHVLKERVPQILELQRCYIWSPPPVTLPEIPKVSYYTMTSATQHLPLQPTSTDTLVFIISNW